MTLKASLEQLMKLKLTVSLILPTLIMLGSTGCVTGTDSYTRDIVYRDGSYYSPADDQNGDYYYAPEPDYSYYADDYYDSYYGFNQNYYRSSRYGRYESGCRFSYHYDRYCDNRWGSSYLNFGGLTIIFGNSNRYDYGYGYGYGNSYGYGHSNYGYGSGGYNNGYPYYYGGGYPYYGSHTPRPRPRSNDPIPMSKPTRPTGHTPDNNFSGGSNIRVAGEPTRTVSKPGLVDTNSLEPSNEVQERAQDNRNPYTRTGNERRRNIQPEIWRNAVDDNADSGIAIRGNRQPRQMVQEQYAPRVRTKPALLIDGNAYEVSDRQRQQQERRVQPYMRDNNAAAMEREKAPTRDYSNNAPPEQARERSDNREERQAAPPRERAERVERTQQSEAPIRAARAESNEEANGADETR
jgi:hypothetical protein